MEYVHKEIGGEFWDIPTAERPNGLFDGQTQWFLSGRSALTRILAEIGQRTPRRKAALPAWCCDSMIKPFLNAGFSVSFYPVYRENGRLVQRLFAADGCDVLLVLDYFGYVGEQTALPGNPICIRDLTHSVLTRKYTDADYCFGSLRKWAGFWTGGFAWGCVPDRLPVDENYADLRKRAMQEKARYIYAETRDKGYLETFALAEEQLEDSPLAGAAARDVAKAEKLDIDRIRKARRENATQLLEAFADIAVFPDLGEQDCPLFVPILVPDGRRDALRRHLIENQIYCPVHWPLSPYHRLDAREKILYENGLSLVCDQRYTPEDMERLINEVKRFWRG